MIEINLQIDDVDTMFNIPDKWEDVTVAQYQKISAIDKTDKTDIDVLTEILVILTGMSKDIIYMTPIDSFNEMTNVLMFTTKAITEDPMDSVLVNGEEYWLKKDFNGQLTTGESISIETLLEKVDNNVEAIMDQLLCIFLRKKKENGNLETFQMSFMERADMFGTISITEVYNIFSFFSDGSSI